VCCQTNPQFILSLSGIIKFVLEGKILPRAAYTPKFCGKSNRKIVLAKSFENVKFVLAKIIPVSGSRSSRYQSRSWSSRYRSRFRQSRSSWCLFQFSWYRTSRLDLNLNCFDLDLTGIGQYRSWFSRSRSFRYRSRSFRYRSRSFRYRTRFHRSRSSRCQSQFSWYRTSRFDLDLNCLDLDLKDIGFDLDLNGLSTILPVLVFPVLISVFPVSIYSEVSCKKYLIML